MTATIKSIKDRGTEIKNASEVGEVMAAKEGAIIEDIADSLQLLDENKLSFSDVQTSVTDSEKPISSNAVLKSLLNIEGIDYGTTEIPDDMNNIVTTYDMVDSSAIWGADGHIEANTNYRYNAFFIPVTPNTGYLSNAAPIGNAIYFYDTNQNVLSFGGREFTTPANCAFIRYNVGTNFNSDVYIIKKPTGETVKGNTLKIDLGVGNLRNASPISGVSGNNLIPNHIVYNTGALHGDTNSPTLTGYHSNEYFAVLPTTVYESNVSYGNPSFLFYDKDKNYIGYIGNSTNFTTPFNCFFVRINSKTQIQGAYYLRETGNQGYQVKDLYITESHIIKDENYGEEQEVIPSREGNSTIPQNNIYCYANNDVLYGVFITKIGFNANGAGNLRVLFGSDNQGNAPTFDKTFSFVAGYNEIEIGNKFLANQFLCFQSSGGGYRYYEGTPNPVGGGIRGAATNNNGDLCIAIFARKVIDGNVDATVEWQALGDSITVPVTSYVYQANSLFKANITNRAVSGQTVMGINQFINQINAIPNNFEGVITSLIGVNDSKNGTTLGSVSETLAKAENALTLTNNFTDAFRYCIVQLMNKAPLATIIFISPIYHAGNSNLPNYVEAEKQICEAYNIPFLTLDSKISQFTASKYLSDGLHPNEAGDIEMGRDTKVKLYNYFFSK